MAKLADNHDADVHRLIFAACNEATVLLYQARRDDADYAAERIEQVFALTRQLAALAPEVRRYRDACILSPRQQEAVYDLSGPSWHQLAIDLAQLVASLVYWAVADVDGANGDAIDLTHCAPYLAGSAFRARPEFVGVAMPEQIKTDLARYWPTIVKALREVPVDDLGDARMRAGLRIEAKAVAVEAANKPAEETPVYLGDGRIQIGGDTIVLEDVEYSVLESLIELGAANKPRLIEQSGNDQAPRILTKLLKKYEDLRPYVTLPRKRGRGGYRTSILRAPIAHQ